MFRLKSVLFSLILFLLVFDVPAQESALLKIDTTDLKRHLTYLASDELQGRSFGTDVDGLEMAAQYIAENAKQNGLKPAAGDYFQEFELVSVKPDPHNFIEVKNSRGKSVYRSDEFVKLTRGTAPVQFENENVILAGFGFSDTKPGYDDLDGTDVEGKVVVISQGSPAEFEKGDPVGWNNRAERQKLDSISGKNPKAVLLVTSTLDKENNTFNRIRAFYSRGRYRLSEPGETSEVPVFVVTPQLADGLLGGKGKYQKYLASIAKTKKPDTFLSKKTGLSLEAVTLKNKVGAKNVIGVVEGSDPELKNEYVVFMAHYDHVGMNRDGEVFNGADDNGSGTVALMEVAEAFASLEKKTKRSIVFLWVTCEEIGLMGSGYYVEHPLFPLEKTVTCVNLDMVGRVAEPRDSVWNRSPKKVKDFDGLFTLSNDAWPQLAVISKTKCEELGIVPDTTLPANFLRSSDHYHFHRNGVPVLNYATGYHADYHETGDEVSKINFKKIKRVADLCFLVGMEVANHEKIEIKRDNNP